MLRTVIGSDMRGSQHIITMLEVTPPHNKEHLIVPAFGTNTILALIVLAALILEGSTELRNENQVQYHLEKEYLSVFSLTKR